MYRFPPKSPRLSCRSVRRTRELRRSLFLRRKPREAVSKIDRPMRPVAFMCRSAQESGSRYGLRMSPDPGSGAIGRSCSNHVPQRFKVAVQTTQIGETSRGIDLSIEARTNPVACKRPLTSAQSRVVSDRCFLSSHCSQELARAHERSWSQRPFAWS